MRKFKLFVMAVVFSAFLVPDPGFAKLVTEWQDALNISGTGGTGEFYGLGRKASDGSLFAYYHFDLGTESNLYIQKININGEELWGNRGKLVDEIDRYNDTVELVPDQNGGAIAVWRKRVDPWTIELRAKRFDSNGNEDLSWGTDGVLISSSVGCGTHCTAVTDGAGGAIVLWVNSGIFAQRVGSDGQLKWNNGEPLFVGEGGLYNGWEEANNLVPDGNGGVFIAWRWNDPVYGVNRLRVQHLDSNGSPQLPYGGLIATSASVSMWQVGDLIPDGTGGVIITANIVYDVVLAQRVDSMGNLPWGIDGIVVKNVEDWCWAPRLTFIESVGNGEFVVV
jgi:hypothetical protein